MDIQGSSTLIKCHFAPSKARRILRDESPRRVRAVFVKIVVCAAALRNGRQELTVKQEKLLK